MKILLTGGSGMVGRNVLDLAAARGITLTAPPSRELDLRDAVATARFVADMAPDFVVHAAGAVGGIQANIREPVRFLVDNLDMGRNLVLACRAARVPRLLNLGSSCMYPRNSPDPLREEQVLAGELEPTNEGYALAKIAVARLCDYVSREDAALSYKTLIPCNLYGRHDKFHPAHSHLVPAVIHKLHRAKVEGREVVDIWGDGTARREFMFAQDLADAVLQAIDRFESLPAMTNIGPGHDHSVNDYYAAAAQVVGWQGRFEHDLSRPVGMMRKLTDVTRAHAWGWHASTGLVDGLAATYRHYLESGIANELSAC